MKQRQNYSRYPIKVNIFSNLLNTDFVYLLHFYNFDHSEQRLPFCSQINFCIISPEVKRISKKFQNLTDLHLFYYTGNFQVRQKTFVLKVHQFVFWPVRCVVLEQYAAVTLTMPLFTREYKTAVTKRQEKLENCCMEGYSRQINIPSQGVNDTCSLIMLTDLVRQASAF